MNAQPSQPLQTCPNCMEFYLRGHLEGQDHARLSAEEAAYLAARVQRALELEAEETRRLARAAIAAIDVQQSRQAPESTYIPMRPAPAGGSR